VIDGSKALRKAITEVFGSRAPVQRCQRHKERNLTDQLPERERAAIRGRLRAAWALAEHELARSRLDLLACELDASWPNAARSLREGMEETLTLTRLGISGQLAKTLASTNACESMIETVRYTQRNVKSWQSGDMRLRWSAAGMLEGDDLEPVDRVEVVGVARVDRQSVRERGRGDHRVVGAGRGLAASASQRGGDLSERSRKTSDHHTGTAVAKFHDERDTPQSNRSHRSPWVRPRVNFPWMALRGREGLSHRMPLGQRCKKTLRRPSGRHHAAGRRPRRPASGRARLRSARDARRHPPRR